MPKLRAITIILLLACAGGLLSMANAAEQPKTFDIEAEEGGMMFNFDTGQIVYTNGVVVRYGEATLSARRARLNRETGEILAEGSVRLQQENEVWFGERIEYNFKTKKILATDFKAGQPPFFIKGAALAGDQGSQVYVLADGIVTTDDYAEPGYSVRARVLSIAPGDFIEAKDAVLYLKDTPVFWFPKWRRSLKRHPNHWVFTPGYRSKYGPYVLSTYEWYWSDRIDGAIRMDERLRRGFGVGPDLNYHLPHFGDGAFKYYYTQDERPGKDPLGEPIDEERQRISFTHQGALRTNLT